MKSAKILFITLISLFVSNISFGQNLNGTWSGWLVSDKDTFDLMLEIIQETHKSANLTTSGSNIFTGKATLVAKDQTFASITFSGKHTFKGILYEEVELLPSSVLKTDLKKSKLIYDINEKEEIEILSGKWTDVTTGASCNNCFLYVTKSTKKVIKSNFAVAETPIPPSDPGFEPFEIELISDSSGKILEAQNRKVKTGTTIKVTGKEISILLFDGRKEDGDKVSIILNNKVVLYNYRVSKNPYKVALTLDKSLKKNSVVFYAENLGDIPPNTCVISVISDGKKVKNIQVESDLDSSDVLYLIP